MIREKLLEKYDRMNKQSIPKTQREKPLHAKYPYKVTCTNWGKYGHKSKYFWHIEGDNVPKIYYCDKPGHVSKYFHKRTSEEKPRNNNNK